MAVPSTPIVAQGSYWVPPTHVFRGFAALGMISMLVSAIAKQRFSFFQGALLVAVSLLSEHVVKNLQVELGELRKFPIGSDKTEIVHLRKDVSRPTTPTDHDTRKPIGSDKTEIVHLGKEVSPPTTTTDHDTRKPNSQRGASQSDIGGDTVVVVDQSSLVKSFLPDDPM